MFFRKIKSDPSDAPRARVPIAQQLVGLTFALAMAWLIFAEDSPVNRDAKRAQKQAQTEPAPAKDGKPVPAAKQRAKVPAPAIASTSPAITDSLVALGLADHLVGRSPFCRMADGALPVVGDLRSFDAERLALAAPDVLFVQPPLAGVDPALREFCEKKSIKLVERRLESLSDVEALVDDIAGVFGVAPNMGGTPLERTLGAAKASIAPGTRAPEGARKVLLVVSAEPFLAVGEGTYLDELLGGAELANALGRPGYVELSAEALVALSPATILGVAETAEGARRMAELLARVPWKENAAPKIAVDAVPGLLSPSLVAVAKRAELVRLAEAAK